MKATAFAVSLLVCSVAALADPEPPELIAARSRYQQDLEFAARPIRVRHIAALEQLKKSLDARRDIQGSLSVQQEIVRLSGESVLSRLAGTWKISYSNRHTRTYIIQPDATATWLSEDGRSIDNQRTKLRADGDAFLIEWNEDKIERLSLTRDGLRVEHFSPKSKFAAKAAPMLGTGILTQTK